MHIRFCIRGVAWSSGQHRRLPLQVSRVRISVFPLFSSLKFSKALREESHSTRGHEDAGAAKMARWRDGEMMTEMKSRQANQEWLREWFGSFCRRLNGQRRARNDLERKIIITCCYEIMGSTQTNSIWKMIFEQQKIKDLPVMVATWKKNYV